MAVLSLLWVQLLVMPFISTLLQGQEPQPQRSQRKYLLQSSVVFPPLSTFPLALAKAVLSNHFLTHREDTGVTVWLQH